MPFIMMSSFSMFQFSTNFQFSIQNDEESVTRCTIYLTERRLFSHLVLTFPLKHNFQELKTCLLWMLWTFYTQNEPQELWSQCAKQTNLATIIQGKYGLECEVFMLLSSDLIVTLFQNSFMITRLHCGSILCFKRK